LASPAYVQRCFEIEATNAASATVRLWALTGEMNGITEPRVFRYVAPDWELLSTNAITGTQGVHTYAEAVTPGFSHFLIAQDGGSPTAIGAHSVGAQAAGSVRWPLLLIAVAALGVAAGARKLRSLRRRGSMLAPQHERSAIHECLVDRTENQDG
jgi:hypothetical protein